MADKFHFLNAGGAFSDEVIEKLRASSVTALTLCRNALETFPLDLVFVNSPKNTVPAYGFGGMSQDSNLIYIYTDTGHKKFIDNIAGELQRTLSHEYHHCCRRNSVGYGETLGEYFVSEGLADYFTFEIFGEPLSPWSTALSQDELKQWFAKAQPLLQSDDFDYFDWFLGFSGKIPMWTGYSLGWQVISTYIAKNSESSASSLVNVAAEKILAQAGGMTLATMPSD